jgi:hypothetical protein
MWLPGPGLLHPLAFSAINRNRARPPLAGSRVMRGIIQSRYEMLRVPSGSLPGFLVSSLADVRLVADDSTHGGKPERNRREDGCFPAHQVMWTSPQWAVEKSTLGFVHTLPSDLSPVNGSNCTKLRIHMRVTRKSPPKSR